MSSNFTLRGLSVQSIHGDRSAVVPLGHMRLCQSLCSVLFCREQYDREQALDDFKTGTVLCYCLVLSVYCTYVYKYKKSFLLNEGGYRDGKL